MVYQDRLNALAEQRLRRSVTGLTGSSAAALEQWKARRRAGVEAEAAKESLIGEAVSLADSDTLERILGRNDLIDIGFFDRMREVSRAVCRVELVGGGAGTGWLIAPNLLITNNHVLPDWSAAAEAVVVFEVDTRLARGKPFKLDPARFFMTSGELDLDYTIVAVQEADESTLAAYGSLATAPALVPTIALGEPVNIIQHPDGEHKQFAIRENEVIAVQQNFLHYRTDTNPGSSGSPVFNNQWQVVALHHSGVPRRVDGQIVDRRGRVWTDDMGDRAIDWIANEGVRIDAILRDLRDRADLAGKTMLGDLVIFETVTDLHVDASSPARRPMVTGAPPAVGPSPQLQARDEPVGFGRTLPGSARHVATIVVPVCVQVSVGAPQGAGVVASSAPQASAEGRGRVIADDHDLT